MKANRALMAVAAGMLALCACEKVGENDASLEIPEIVVPGGHEADEAAGERAKSSVKISVTGLDKTVVRGTRVNVKVEATCNSPLLYGGSGSPRDTIDTITSSPELSGSDLTGDEQQQKLTGYVDTGALKPGTHTYVFTVYVITQFDLLLGKIPYRATKSESHTLTVTEMPSKPKEEKVEKEEPHSDGCCS